MRRRRFVLALALAGLSVPLPCAAQVAVPIEQPSTFELVVNQQTAKTLGLAMPPSLILRADKVIE